MTSEEKEEIEVVNEELWKENTHEDTPVDDTLTEENLWTERKEVQAMIMGTTETSVETLSVTAALVAGALGNWPTVDMAQTRDHPRAKIEVYAENEAKTPPAAPETTAAKEQSMKARQKLPNETETTLKKRLEKRMRMLARQPIQRHQQPPHWSVEMGEKSPEAEARREISRSTIPQSRPTILETTAQMGEAMTEETRYETKEETTRSARLVRL